MKTLIVDAQLWQTNAWFRGMGGYTRNLIRTLLSQEEIKLAVVLNRHIPTDRSRLDLIAQELPNAAIYQLDLPINPSPADSERARTTLNKFVDKNFSGVGDLYYLAAAPFLFDYAAVFPSRTKNILLFYDLIPIIYWRHFAQYFPPHLYFPRFELLFQADAVLTISETTALDLQRYFGVAPDKLHNLDGSINKRLSSDGDAGNRKTVSTGILGRLGLGRKHFFLMPTGGLPHKNNVRAAQAFHDLVGNLGTRDVRLVATSFFDDLERSELQLIARNSIIFTGNVSEDEMTELYERCDAVVFPSLYEGLGIPVLEGVAHNKPVACADIPVFREIPRCEEALYMFNPTDVSAMSEAMLRALAKAGFDRKRSWYPAILEKYSWARSAKLFAQAMESAASYRPAPITKRIAVTCPDPRKNDNVGVMAQRLSGYGRTRGIEFVYFIDSGNEDGIGEQYLPDYVRSITACYDIDDYYREMDRQRFDKVLHVLCNDVQFQKQYRAAMFTPGWIYIGNDTYWPVVEKMAAEGMISASQLEAERAMTISGEEAHRFGGLALLANAQGVFAERHILPSVRASMEKYGFNAAVVEVPESAIMQTDAAMQLQVFDKIISILTGGVGDK